MEVFHLVGAIMDHFLADHNVLIEQFLQGNVSNKARHHLLMKQLLDGDLPSMRYK